jgi:cytochrome c-type biogenesis protein
LSDADLKTIKSYGVENGTVAQRSYFIIDRSGVLRYKKILQRGEGLVPNETLLEEVKKIHAQNPYEAPPRNDPLARFDACGARQRAGAQPAAQPAAKVNYKLVPNLEPMKDNSPTPDFTVVDPAGKKVSLKDYRGKLVLLNFWATWCVPCREEMPAMERLYEQYKNKGFTIVGIDVKGQQEGRVRVSERAQNQLSDHARSGRRSRAAVRALGAADDLSDRPKGRRARAHVGAGGLGRRRRQAGYPGPPRRQAMNEVNFVVAFTSGLLSFLSPCVLPVIPSYLSFISGVSLDEITAPSAESGARRRVVLNALAFIIGFSIVFVSLGASASALYGVFAGHRRSIRIAGGLAVILVGVYLLGFVKIPALDRYFQLNLKDKPAGYLGSALVGVTFAVRVDSVRRPILGAILALAATSRSGVLLLGCYAAGLAVPFFFERRCRRFFFSLLEALSPLHSLCAHRRRRYADRDRGAARVRLFFAIEYLRDQVYAALAARTPLGRFGLRLRFRVTGRRSIHWKTRNFVV